MKNKHNYIVLILLVFLITVNFGCAGKNPDGSRRLSILNIQEEAYKFNSDNGQCMARAKEALRLAQENGYQAEIKYVYKAGRGYKARDYYHAYVIINGEEILNNPDTSWDRQELLDKITKG